MEIHQRRVARVVRGRHPFRPDPVGGYRLDIDIGGEPIC
jgi:hypothetical protein